MFAIMVSIGFTVSPLPPVPEAGLDGSIPAITSVSAVINYKITPELDKLRSCIFKKTILEGENPEAGGGGGL